MRRKTLADKLWAEPRIRRNTRRVLKLFQNLDKKKFEEGRQERSLAKMAHALGLKTAEWRKILNSSMVQVEYLMKKYPELRRSALKGKKS